MFEMTFRICCMGGRGSGPRLKNHKNIGFHSNSDPDPLKNYEATEPAFNVGPSSARRRNAIGLKHILFDQSLLHRYNIIGVGSDSKP